MTFPFMFRFLESLKQTKRLDRIQRIMYLTPALQRSYVLQTRIFYTKIKFLLKLREISKHQRHSKISYSLRFFMELLMGFHRSKRSRKKDVQGVHSNFSKEKQSNPSHCILICLDDILISQVILKFNF